MHLQSLDQSVLRFSVLFLIILLMKQQKYEKLFIWDDSSHKIKHETLRKNFKTGGLKNVDVCVKFVSLQFTWVKKLYDDCFHEGKIIPLHLLSKYFGLHFKFCKKLVSYQYGIYPLRYFLPILLFFMLSETSAFEKDIWDISTIRQIMEL